jgi:GntR family transcriptional regulator / MocR family aminotransferase
MLSEYLLAEISRPGPAGRAAAAPPLYEAMRRAMLDGKLTSGDRLPSSRDLAQDLDLSRNTVVAAHQPADGGGLPGQPCGQWHLCARPGAAAVPGQGLAARCRRPGAPVRRGAKRWPTALRQRTGDPALHPGAADFSAFPVALWQRLQNKHWRHAGPAMLDYNDSGGYGPLRRAVADYLRVFRSVPLDADQVLITSGTQQSLELCAHLLADHGDTVWLEDPAYWGAVKAFTATGLAIHPVPVDDEGMAPRDSDHARPPRLIYVTPSHQYPSGAVMSLARRQQLLASAACQRLGAGRRLRQRVPLQRPAHLVSLKAWTRPSGCSTWARFPRCCTPG